MVLVADDESVAAHFGKFRGEAAAVESEVVCEFLSVEWDDKVAALVFQRLFGEIGEDAEPYRSGLRVVHPLRELDALHRGELQEVADELLRQEVGGSGRVYDRTYID